MSQFESEKREHDREVVRRNLLSRLSYVKLYEEFRRSRVERDVIPLVEAILRDEREMLSELGSLMRHLGEAIVSEGGDARLTAQLRACRGTLERLKFLAHGSRRAADWYHLSAEDAGLSPAVRESFRSFGDRMRQRTQSIERLIDNLHKPRTPWRSRR